MVVWHELIIYPLLSVGGRRVDELLDVRGRPLESLQKGISKWLKVCKMCITLYIIIISKLYGRVREN